MIVCLDLHYDSITESLAERPPHYDMYFWTPAQRAEMVQALETSQRIWKESQETSMEAYKASNIIGVMLEKVRYKTKPADEPTTSEVFAQFDDANLKPEHSAAMTLGMLSGGLSPNSAAIFNNALQSPRGTNYANFDMSMGDSSGNTGLTPNYTGDVANQFGTVNNVASPFSVFGNAGSGNGMMDVPANLDWEAWDSYIQTGNPIDPTFQYYPTTIDQSQLSPEGQQGQVQDQSTFGSSVFMGANTPGR